MLKQIRFAYALRWLLFITVWGWVIVQPSAPLVIVGAPQAVLTHNAKAGVHTRLTG